MKTACPQCPVVALLEHHLKDKEDIIKILKHEIIALKQQLWLEQMGIN